MMVNRVLGAALVAAALAFSGTAGQAADYRIDSGHSFVQFKISHVGVSWMIGTFEEISGSFTFDSDAGPEAQSISVEIETASVDTNHAERDKHLRSADFLNVDEFPTATFVSTGYEGDAEGGTMTGDLTLHGVTREIAIAVSKVGEGKDPWGGYRAGFEGSVSLTRKDFGMGYNLGPAAETMKLFLFIEGVRQ
ncbi:MAG: YceI family protein [Rhodospirillales bacterium]|nr:YceI family protein [Rhodospirillales bacterium]MDE0380349.1 YceI family protein [Rhodospirillales bacterium]